jgi:hypothetical protein
MRNIYIHWVGKRQSRLMLKHVVHSNHYHLKGERARDHRGIWCINPTLTSREQLNIRHVTILWRFPAGSDTKRASHGFTAVSIPMVILTSSMKQGSTWVTHSRSSGKKFPASQTVRWFITVFTRTRHWTRSCACWMQFTHSHTNLIFKEIY